MKTLLFICISINLFSASVNAQDWVSYRSVAGKFTVQLPSWPKETVDTSDSEHGPYVTHLFVCNADKDIFLVGWVDYDTSFHFDNKSEMLANRDNFVKAVGATVYETKDISYKGNPGIEFTAGGENLFISSRVYIIGRRPYQLITVSKTGKASRDLNRFYNSFKIGR